MEAVRPSVGKIRRAQSAQRGTSEDGKAEPGGVSDWAAREHGCVLCRLQATQHASQKLGTPG